MIFTLFMALILVSSSSCAVSSKYGPTGVRGTVMIGPIPSVSEEGKFDVEPYPDATIFVMDAAGKNKIAEAITDQEGFFKVELDPGQYLLVPQTPEGQTFPTGETKKVLVRAYGFTDVILNYNSGLK